MSKIQKTIMAAMLIVTVLMLFTLLNLVNASAMADASQHPGSFSVHAQLPDNQVTDDVSYFYIDAKPGAVQVLEVEVFNYGDHAIAVDLEANSAFTNAHGVIDYSAQGEGTFGIDFAALVEIEQPKLFVPAKGSAMASFTLTMPDKPIVGDVLGGLIFTKSRSAGGEGAQSSGSMAISHVFNYCIAVRIAGERPAKELPQLTFDGVRIGDVAGFESLIIDIVNQSPLIIKDMDLSIHAYADDMTQVFHIDGRSVSMAPHSVMPYTLLLRDVPPLDAGTYHIKALLRYEDEAWLFEAPVEIA